MLFNLKLSTWKSIVASSLLALITGISSLLFLLSTPAFASINDDGYDGNIFILYAGNGSLVPPRLTLEESLQREMPSLLVFYVDDSSDCKEYSIVVSRLQEFYGRAANIMPIAVDSIPLKDNYGKLEPGYYYEGVVPQTVLLDQQGNLVLNRKGQATFEEIDDKFREIFDLLPRSESVELKRRTFNEFNSELVN